MNAQTSAESAFYQSYGLEKAGKYFDAVSTLKGIYDPKSYEINLRLGYLSYMAKSYSESITYYKKATELLPLSIEAKMGLVIPLSVQNNWDEIIAIYKDILKVDPMNSTVNYRLGIIYYNKGDYATSLSYLEKVVNQYPFHYDGLIMYAWANLKMEKFANAKSTFNKVLLLSPDDKSAREGLSLIKG